MDAIEDRVLLIIAGPPFPVFGSTVSTASHSDLEWSKLKQA